VLINVNVNVGRASMNPRYKNMYLIRGVHQCLGETEEYFATFYTQITRYRTQI